MPPFSPASASAVAAAVAASTAAVPSPSAAVAAPPAAVPAPPPSSAVLPVWKEATIRDPDGPHFVPGAARYRYDPTFGFFPHFHTGDGLLHVVSLGIGASFIVKSLLHSTGWLIVYNEICTPPPTYQSILGKIYVTFQFMVTCTHFFYPLSPSFCRTFGWSVSPLVSFTPFGVYGQHMSAIVKKID